MSGDLPPEEIRFVVIGAGAIGGVVGGRLHQHGHQVVLVARGAQLAAIQSTGLLIEDPDGAATVEVPVVGSVSEITWRAGDVVFLAVKGQDTVGALQEMRASMPIDVPVFCLQNGVDNERQVLRIFPQVYGVCVLCPATYLEAGVVEVASAPVSGVLDIGRYPSGSDHLAATVATMLSRSTFSSVVRPDVMRWKHGKLLSNLRNVIQVVCAPGSGAEVGRLVRAEAEACLEAAAIPFSSSDEEAARRRGLVEDRPVGGRPRAGSSSWQSIARGAGSIETDLLNGEVVLLGRIHGVPTPVNEVLQRLADEVVRGRRQARALSDEDVLAVS